MKKLLGLLLLIPTLAFGQSMGSAQGFANSSTSGGGSGGSGSAPTGCSVALGILSCTGFNASTSLVVGLASTATGTLGMAGTTSGTVTIQPQAAAGTFNFNLPVTAGTSGQYLTSAGGGSSAMTWATGGVFITGTAAITPGTITANTCSDSGTTVTVTGAAVGDACMLGVPAAGAGTHIDATCYISATNTATVRFCNVNTGDQTGTTGTYRASVQH